MSQANWTKLPPAPPKQTPRTALSAVETEPATQCPQCHSLTTNTALQFNDMVCPACEHHFRLGAKARLNWFFDEIQETIGEDITPSDPLGFVDQMPYLERLKRAQDKTGATEGLSCARGRAGNLDVVAAAFDFDFMGGSMGSAVGGRFVAAAKYAIAHHLPLVCFAASGGARMQEGMLSLMQMARTSAIIEELQSASLPYIVVMTHPVYGGVTASLAMLGDVHLSEPKAMIGFAGKRVIEQTVREVLDEPFQRAEFLLEHGVIDQVVHRHQLKATLIRLLGKFMYI